MADEVPHDDYTQNVSDESSRHEHGVERYARDVVVVAEVPRNVAVGAVVLK